MRGGGCGCALVGLVLLAVLGPILMEGFVWLLIFGVMFLAFMAFRNAFSSSALPPMSSPPPVPERRPQPEPHATVRALAARDPVQALEELPQVRELTARLRESLAAAEETGDARWAYDARACLEEYLPETLRLHAASGRPDSDPEFLEALNDIRVIGVGPLESVREGRWAAHRHFLAWRSGAVREGDAALTPLPELRLDEREPVPARPKETHDPSDREP